MAVPTLADWSFGATIPAKDLDGTRRFYEKVLGAHVVDEDQGGILYKAGDSYFSLYPTQFAGTAQHTLAGWNVDDVEATVSELRERGVVFEEYDFPGMTTVDGIAEIEGNYPSKGVGERGVWFHDSEGNLLGIGQPVRATGTTG